MDIQPQRKRKSWLYQKGVNTSEETTFESSSHDDDCGCWHVCCGDNVDMWCITRDRLYDLVNDEGSSLGAAIYASINFLFILESLILLIVLSEPDNWINPHPIFFWLETCNVVFFTFDYLAKFILTRKNRCWWLIDFLNIIDFLTIAPYYIELLFEALSGFAFVYVFRALRLMRILRIFKLFRFFKDFRLVVAAVKKSGPAFLLLISSLSITTTFYGSLLFYAEQSRSYFNSTELLWYYDNGELSPYQNVVVSFWWALVTITTVGYGDTTPYSELGRIVATLLMLTGILTLVLPSTVIGINFAEVYNEAHTKTLERYLAKNRTNIRRLRRKRGVMKMIISLETELQRASSTLALLKENLSGITAIYEDVEQIAGLIAEEIHPE
eukprot:TRINITY_DN4191_c0_g1_i1.p1 TRINITY_DN4191_c0_g1~~TRINITY_DN4191_c0_g1_i1.p1  ORF type:complete len:383 (-),score=64.83 TRINITY_DN4191_c0_g1_i1:103-1251(-)